MSSTVSTSSFKLLSSFHFLFTSTQTSPSFTAYGVSACTCWTLIDGKFGRRMNEEEQHLYFTEEFKLGPNYRTTYKTTLRKDCIIYEAKSDSIVNIILLNDVTGVQISHSIHSNERFEQNAAFIHIYSYPLKKKRFSKHYRRHRKEYVFCVGNGKDFNENKALAERWTNVMKSLLTTGDVEYEKGL